MTIHCSNCGYLKCSAIEPMCEACVAELALTTTGLAFRDYRGAQAYVEKRGKLAIPNWLCRIYRDKRRRKYIVTAYGTELPRARFEELSTRIFAY